MTLSILGYLTTRFASSPENIATEALYFVLGKSHVVRDSFVEYFNQASIDIPNSLVFRTQVAGDDNSIPDLIGFGKDGESTLICEAKFWAGLTSNQPITYINRLPYEKKAILVFIAPSKRFPTLWAELINRCSVAGVDLKEIRNIGSGLLVGKINSYHSLGLCSWSALLAYLYNRANANDLKEIAEDIRQLSSLCERMDTDAFLPLQSEEMSPNHGIRYLHYHQIIDEVTDILVGYRMVNTDGLRATPGYGRYTRYMKTNTYGLGLQFSAEYWSKLRETPIWLSIKEISPTKNSWVFPSSARESLIALEVMQPPKLVVQDDCLLVALYLPIGEEKSKVINSIVEQVKEVLEMLKSA